MRNLRFRIPDIASSLAAVKNPFLNFSLCLSVALATTLTSCQYIPGLKKSKQAPIAARPAMGAPAQPRQAVASNPYRGTGARNPDSNLPSTLPAGVRTRYSSVPTNEMVLAMTFDDGPHPTYTPRLLDMLKERNIKATFFMVGQCATAYPAVVKRIAEEGHEVANHSWSHPNLAPLKETKIMDQLQKTHDAIVNACGVAPILYRPPYGSIRMTQRKAIHDKFGYPTILWDVDPNDWQPPRTVSKVHNRVLAQTKPGSIILCHDIHKPTVDAMPGVLDELLARGYRFVTVTELINLDSQTAQKHAALAAQKLAEEEAAKAAAAGAAATAAGTPPGTTPATTVAPAIIPEKKTPSQTPVPAPTPGSVQPPASGSTGSPPAQPPVAR